MKIILTGATGYVGEGVIINPRDITKLAISCKCLKIARTKTIFAQILAYIKKNQ